MNLCQSPERACEVTLQPLARFPLDAAILFSDILTVLPPLGFDLAFREGEGPRISNPLRSGDGRNLTAFDPVQELSYVMDAVRACRQALPADLPLIGFAGAPWTVACYAVDRKTWADAGLAHWLPLRWRLTVVATLSCVFGAAGT